MFWNKKDEEKSLPDLPPLQSPFSKELAVPDISTISEEENEEKHSLPSFPDSPINKGFAQAAIKDAIDTAPIDTTIENTEPELVSAPGSTEKVFRTVELDEENSHPSISIATPTKTSPIRVQQMPPSLSQSMTPSLPQRIAPPPSSPRIPSQPVPISQPMPKSIAQPMALPMSIPMSLPMPPMMQQQTSSQSSMSSMPPMNAMSLTNRPTRDKDIFVKIEKYQSARRTLQTTQDQLEEIDSLLKKIRETKLREEQELSAWEKELSVIKSRVQDVTEIFEKVA